MILGRRRHVHSACFDEIDAAVNALLREQERTDVPVCFNAHSFPAEIPTGAIVFNLESVGLQAAPSLFGHHEIWDFSERNVQIWREAGKDVHHVPIGHHPSMRRFVRRSRHERDIDVVFAGCPSVRRSKILAELVSKGLKVVHVPHTSYGEERDLILSRAKLALNVLFYTDACYPALRSAHAIANGLPILCEQGPEMPAWCTMSADYDRVVDRVVELLGSPAVLDEEADKSYDAFARTPLALPYAREVKA